MEETITFAPELDRSQLNRETRDIDRELEDVATDINTSFDSDLSGVQSELDSLEPAGGGGGGAGVGSGAAAGGLASRIPKPIAGVVAAKALPVALSGAVGVGMLGAMQSASARLQTSASLMGQAWDHIWRPLGDMLDDLIVRDLVEEIFEHTRDFSEAMELIDTDMMLPRSFEEVGNRLRPIAASLEMIPLPKFQSLSRGVHMMADHLESFTWPSLPSFSWPSLPEFSWPSLPSFSWPSLPSFSWPSLPSFSWPSLPQFNWPSLPQFDWPSLPSFSWPSLPSFSWPSLPSFSWPSLPEFSWPSLPSFSWPSLPDFSWPSRDQLLGGLSWPSSSDILDKFPSINRSALTDAVRPGGGSSGGGSSEPDSGGPPSRSPASGRTSSNGSSSSSLGERAAGLVSSGITGPIRFARGGVVRRPTQIGPNSVAGEAGPEVIAPFAELRRTIESVMQQSAGSGGGDVDMSRVESKLDDLNRNVRRLNDALNVQVNIDREDLGRASRDAQVNFMSDTDPSA